MVVLDYTLMDEEVLSRCPRLRFVAFLGIGYASCIDIEAATRRGIVVSTPDYGAASVAEHALGMILALTRHIATAYVSLKSERWEPGGFQGMGSTARPAGRARAHWPGDGPTRGRHRHEAGRLDAERDAGPRAPRARPGPAPGGLQPIGRGVDPPLASAGDRAPGRARSSPG